MPPGTNLQMKIPERKNGKHYLFVIILRVGKVLVLNYYICAFHVVTGYRQSPIIIIIVYKLTMISILFHGIVML